MNLPIELKTRISNHISSVQKHLGDLPADEKREIIQSLETHIHDALTSRASGEPTTEQLETILAELDPPESYSSATPLMASSNKASLSSGRKILFFASTGTLCLLFIAIWMADPFSSHWMDEAAPSATTGDPTQVIPEETGLGTMIVPGTGCGPFIIGSSREELIAALGNPDQGSTDKWLQWKQDRHIHCLVEVTRGAFELRFDKGFDGETSKGIKIGSSEEEVLEAYGEPQHTTDQESAKKLEWSNQGLLIWISDQGVTQIVVFKPY